MFDLTFCVIVDCRAANLLLNLSGQFYKPILGKKFGIYVSEKTTIKMLKRNLKLFLENSDAVCFSYQNFKLENFKELHFWWKKQSASEFFKRSGISIGGADGFAYCVGGILTLVTSCLLKVGQMI
mgnify:CR=1 FL=1